MHKNKLSIFIFRRDHRLQDNSALIQALSCSTQVVPCFIFDTAQIDPRKNPYFSNNCVQFMIESLLDLNTQLQEHNSRLFFFTGDIESTVTHILKTLKPDAFFVNEDVTPYSIKRDKVISDICEANSIKFYSYQDVMLLPKEKVRKPDGSHFTVFSQYHREALKLFIKEPVKYNFTNYYPANLTVEGEFPISDVKLFYNENPDLEVRGGRKKGLQILENMRDFKNYNLTRSVPVIPTTKLSAYNKFGCVSIREVYKAVKDTLGKGCKLMVELFWRDFYYYLAYHEPRLFGETMKPEYLKIKYEDHPDRLEKWMQGNTGCPIVDAGMRHMNKTGYMPNRLRMTVANYLTKDLLVDYKLGEKYFAQILVDYDPCQNNGGWQWSASTGADARDFLRIFNPVLQSQKFDGPCDYILKWVPELASVRKDHIHNWENCYKFYKGKNIDYPDPLVNHAVQRKKCIEMYKNAGVHHDENFLGSQSTMVDEEEEKENEHISEGKMSTTKKRKAEDVTVFNSSLKKTKQNSEEPISGGKASQAKITNWFQKTSVPKEK